jgi:hypothetical protein
MLKLEGLQEEHRVQCELGVPTQNLLLDRGKSRKTKIELAGPINCGMHTDFQPTVRHSNARNLTAVLMYYVLTYITFKDPVRTAQ